MLEVEKNDPWGEYDTTVNELLYYQKDLYLSISLIDLGKFGEDLFNNNKSKCSIYFANY